MLRSLWSRDDELLADVIPSPAPRELTRVEHLRLHHQAVALAAIWREELGLPDVRRITDCPFDTHTYREAA